MTPEEILDNLCAYDERSPHYPDSLECMGIEDMPPPREDCYCDNCFYGRDALAVEILRLRDEPKTIPETQIQ